MPGIAQDVVSSSDSTNRAPTPTRRRRGWAAGLLGLGLLAACPHEVTEEAVHPAPPPTPEDVQWRMHEHFDHVTAIMAAVVVGETETVAERADGLALRTTVPDYPKSWQPHVEQMLREADQLREVNSLPEAAASAARLAAACGNCHLETGATPQFGDVMLPSDDESLSGRMERHQWAAERMWEGIVGPSDASWEQGTSVFVGAPGCGAEFGDDAEGQRMGALCEQVNVLGRRAAAAADGDARRLVYGEFLATCSACHTARR